MILYSHLKNALFLADELVCAPVTVVVPAMVEVLETSISEIVIEDMVDDGILSECS